MYTDFPVPGGPNNKNGLPFSVKKSNNRVINERMLEVHKLKHEQIKPKEEC